VERGDRLARLARALATLGFEAESLWDSPLNYLVLNSSLHKPSDHTEEFWGGIRDRIGYRPIVD
jgi:hypothetical protein